MTWHPDAYAIMGRRMAAGDPVSESYLYGREAAELIRRGHVDEPTMRKYRSGAYFMRKAIYKEPAALDWEEAAKDRHEAAKKMPRFTDE